MILVDVNLLVYALNTDLPAQETAKAWLEGLFHQLTPIGLPWAVLVEFVRIATNPRIFRQALTIEQATTIVQDWLARPNVTVLHPTREHLRHFASCCRAVNATGNLVTDAHLAALAIEHGAELASNDTDFACFPGLRWFNPLAA